MIVQLGASLLLQMLPACTAAPKTVSLHCGSTDMDDSDWMTVVNVSSGGPYLITHVWVDEPVSGNYYAWCRITVDGTLAYESDGQKSEGKAFIGPWVAAHDSVLYLPDDGPMWIFARESFLIEGKKNASFNDTKIGYKYQKLSLG